VGTIKINDLLKIAVERGASDLHLKVGSVPMLRVRGELTPVPGGSRLTDGDLTGAVSDVLPSDARDTFADKREVDIACSVAGLGRFRCNTFQQRGTVGMIFRIIPMRVPDIEQLLLPSVLKRIASEERGFVLVTGTAGSGKSTTLAAMIDHINSTRTGHVMTIEDPIEFLDPDKRSIISQREVGADTRSFSHALRGALRQDPDVILVGEMHDSRPSIRPCWRPRPDISSSRRSIHWTPRKRSIASFPSFQLISSSRFAISSPVWSPPSCRNGWSLKQTARAGYRPSKSW